MKLKHEEITKAITGSAFEVYNILGYGFLEKVYQLLNELKATGTQVGLLINFGKEKLEFKRFVY